MISRKFIQSSLIYSVFGAMPLISGIILLPFYTNMLTTAQFGELALYITFTGIMQLLVNFALDQYLGTHWVDIRDNLQKVRENIGTVVSLLLIIGVAFLLVFAIAGEFIFSSYSGFTGYKTNLLFYPWGLMSLLTAIFNSFFRTYVALLIYQQRPVRFLWLNSLNFILTIGISLSVLFAAPYSLSGPMYGRLLSGLGIFLMALIYFIREYGITFQRKLLKGITIFCLPLFAYYILFWITGNIDRYIIDYFLDSKAVGIFFFAIQCALVIEFLQNGLSYAVYPKVYSIWKEKNINFGTVEVNRYFNGFTAITLLIIPVLVLTFPMVIPLVVKNKDFYLSFNFLAILLSGYALSGLRAYFWAPLMYFKKTKVLPKIFFFSAVFQIIVSIGLIYSFGLIGAVWANILVKPVQILMMYWESRKVYDFRINAWKLVYLPLIFMAFVLISETLVPDSERLLAEAGQLLLAVSMVLIVYRKELVLFIRSRFQR